MTDTPVPVQVLLVEDNPTHQKLIASMLRHARGAAFEVTAVGTVTAALAGLAGGGFDVTLLDLNLPDSEGLDTFHAVQNSAGDTPTVVITGSEELDLGRRAVQAGAQDFLVKGRIEPERLTESILYTIERWHQSRTDALYDPLTGLATRQLLSHRLTEMLGAAERDGDNVAVVAVTLGLRSGDLERKVAEEVLREASRRLRRTLRPFDVLARTGADSFVAVIAGLARPVNAERAAQRVLAGLVGEVSVGGDSVRLPVRVGVAVGRRATDATDVLARAQRAGAEIRLADAPALRVATP